MNAFIFVFAATRDALGHASAPCTDLTDTRNWPFGCITAACLKVHRFGASVAWQACNFRTEGLRQPLQCSVELNTRYPYVIVCKRDFAHQP